MTCTDESGVSQSIQLPLQAKALLEGMICLAALHIHPPDSDTMQQGERFCMLCGLQWPRKEASGHT